IVDQSAARTTASIQSQNHQASIYTAEPTMLSIQSEASPGSPVQSEASPSSPVQSEASPGSPVQSEASPCSSVQSESGLLLALLQLTRSQRAPRAPVCSGPHSMCVSSEGPGVGPWCVVVLTRAPVCVKAYEALLLLASLQESEGELLSLSAQLGELMVGRMKLLHSLLPLEELQHEEILSWPHTPWSSQFSRCSSESPASGHMTNFFSWLDFLDHLMREAPQVLALKLAQCVHRFWLVDVLQPQLLHTSDALSHLLLQRCDHISDQISMASLSLVEELLQKPHRDILDVLVLNYLQSRSYLCSPVGGAEERQLESSEANEDSE
ncbi:hypothetical protein JOQ06_000717, partial [Pogonophryne albipinna]